MFQAPFTSVPPREAAYTSPCAKVCVCVCLRARSYTVPQCEGSLTPRAHAHAPHAAFAGARTREVSILHQAPRAAGPIKEHSHRDRDDRQRRLLCILTAAQETAQWVTLN